MPHARRLAPLALAIGLANLGDSASMAQDDWIREVLASADPLVHAASAAQPRNRERDFRAGLDAADTATVLASLRLLPFSAEPESYLARVQEFVRARDPDIAIEAALSYERIAERIATDAASSSERSVAIAAFCGTWLKKELHGLRSDAAAAHERGQLFLTSTCAPQ